VELAKAALLLTALGAVLYADARLDHAGAQPGDASRAAKSCFFSDQFEEWRAPDTKTIFIRVRPNSYYRLDLGYDCPQLKQPGAQLITKTPGAHMVCSPLDWDLSVSQSPSGIAVQCVVKAMTKLDAGQIAAIPKPFKP
jgi:hypothetical protein